MEVERAPRQALSGLATRPLEAVLCVSLTRHVKWTWAAQVRSKSIRLKFGPDLAPLSCIAEGLRLGQLVEVS